MSAQVQKQGPDITTVVCPDCKCEMSKADFDKHFSEYDGCPNQWRIGW